VWHFAVVAGFVVKFGALQREFTITNCCPYSGGGECASAEYSLGFKIVIVEANDVADTSGYPACNESSSGHPPFQWEGIDVDR
jgi:hypothetical protein